MGELPDFTAMTKEEIGDWFVNNDTSALVAAAGPAVEPMAQVDERGVPVMRPANVQAAARDA